MRSFSKIWKPLALLLAGVVLYVAMVRWLGVWMEHLEAHSLFLWSGYFWRETVSLQGFWAWLSAFFVQFFFSRYVGALLVTLAFGGLCWLVFKRWKGRARALSVGFGIVWIGVVATAYRAYDSEHLHLAEIEREARAERWDRVLDLCTEFLEQSHRQHREWDSLYFEVIDYTKFALSLTHRLPEQFFAYTKYFDRGVLFPDGSSTDVLNYMYFAPKLAYFYYSVGLPTMAMDQSFGCIVQHQSPIWAVETYLKAVQVCDIPCGDILAERLKSSLFHRHRYRLNAAELAAKRALPPIRESETSFYLDNNIITLFNNNPSNRFAYEYAMCAALSYKEHGFVMEHIDRLAEWGYAALPKHFEEGILGCLFFESSTDPSDEALYERTYGGFKLSRERIADVREFIDLVQGYFNSGFGFSRIENRFGDTYWFHFVFGTVDSGRTLVTVDDGHYG